MLVEPGLKLLFRGRGRVDRVLDEKLELLPKAPPQDRVALVEAHGDRLPGGDLLLHAVVDEALELLLGRRPLPHQVEAGGKVLDQAGPVGDAIRAPPLASAAALEIQE